MAENKVTESKTKTSLLSYITNNSNTNNIYKDINQTYKKNHKKDYLTLEHLVLFFVALFTMFYFLSPIFMDFLTSIFFF